MPSPDEIAALVVRVRTGEPAAFDTLVRTFLRPAYVVALTIVGRPSDAEDVAQEALLKAFERIASCREPERFGAWFLQIVRNESRNWLRSRSRRDVPREGFAEEPASREPDPEMVAIQRELLAALWVLGEVQREVVLLHDLEGWTHSQIAEAIGSSETMSRQHLFQARRKLHDVLGGSSSPPGDSDLEPGDPGRSERDMDGGGVTETRSARRDGAVTVREHAGGGT